MTRKFETLITRHEYLRFLETPAGQGIPKPDWWRPLPAPPGSAPAQEKSAAGKALRSSPRPAEQIKAERVKAAVAEAARRWGAGSVLNHFKMAQELSPDYPELPRDRLKSALKKWCYENDRADRVFNAKTRT